MVLPLEEKAKLNMESAGVFIIDPCVLSKAKEQHNNSVILKDQQKSPDSTASTHVTITSSAPAKAEQTLKGHQNLAALSTDSSAKLPTKVLKTTALNKDITERLLSTNTTIKEVAKAKLTQVLKENHQTPVLVNLPSARLLSTNAIVPVRKTPVSIKNPSTALSKTLTKASPVTLPRKMNAFVLQTSKLTISDAARNKEIQRLREMNKNKNHTQLQSKPLTTLSTTTKSNNLQVNQTTPIQTQACSAQYFEFVNEALFDEEDLAKNPVSSETDSDEEELKIEENLIEYALSNPIYDKVECTSIAVQTEEAAEDRIHCGFVNVSKTGCDKYFNLRCFYCDAEFPISFWSEFSDHVIFTHKDLENSYVKNDVKSTANEEIDTFFDVDFKFPLTMTNLNAMNLFNDTDSSDQEFIKEPPQKKPYEKSIKVEPIEYKPKLVITKVPTDELLPEDFNEANDWDSDSDKEQFHMSVKSYNPNIDHCYTQGMNVVEKVANEEPIDQISFAKTPRHIVMDFLEHLKGFPSLWFARDVDSERYDNQLLDLKSIISEKWGLNLKRGYLRKNLENIKAWFVAMTKAKQVSDGKNFTKQFIEYYDKCAEYLPCGNLNKPEKIYCDLCNRFCYDQIGLQLHKYRWHSIGQLPYACNKCDKRFDYIHKLRNHLQKKHAPPPQIPAEMTCGLCEEKFTQVNEFKKHFNTHLMCICDICGYRTKTMGSLGIHKRSHQPPKPPMVPLVCVECDFKCYTHGKMNMHKKTHGEPGYHCEICPKKFHYAHYLKKHMACHEGKLDYICETCGKLFVRKAYLQDHVKYAHMGKGFCKICNRNYNKSSIFHKHLRNVHRPLIGTIEELTKRRHRNVGIRVSQKGKGTGPRLQMRKYTYVSDPVTQKRRLLCPKCDKSYYQYDSLYLHLRNKHGCGAWVHKKPRVRSKGTAKPAKDIVAENTAEAAAAVNTIVENADISQNDPVDLSKTPCNDNETSDFKDVMSLSSFEKCSNEIPLNTDFTLQSTSGGHQQQFVLKAGNISDIKMENTPVIDLEYLLFKYDDTKFT
uniref:Protein suppressor of hairy wing n=2 Tax=Ceratitis capitata TaxID=7213 RepID=W8B2H1_CERCA